jgi:hypothetical protein
MLRLITRVGLKRLIPAGIVLAVGVIFWALIQYGENTQAREQEVQQLQNQVETRNQIDEAIRRTPTDPDGARGVLSDFLDSRQ